MKAYSISFSGLKIGKHHFDYQIDNTFFQEFDFEDFNNAAIAVELVFEKLISLLKSVSLLLLFGSSGSEIVAIADSGQVKQ